MVTIAWWVPCSSFVAGLLFCGYVAYRLAVRVAVRGERLLEQLDIDIDNEIPETLEPSRSTIKATVWLFAGTLIVARLLEHPRARAIVSRVLSFAFCPECGRGICVLQCPNADPVPDLGGDRKTCTHDRKLEGAE